MKKELLILCVSLLILGCSQESSPELTSIETTLIAKDNLYGNGAEGISAQNRVITNDTDWNELLVQMNSVNDITSQFSETNIDFSAFTVIAIFDEIRDHGGYRIGLDVISNSENTMVYVTNLIPQGNLTTIITQPFHIVKIPKSDLPIIFN